MAGLHTLTRTGKRPRARVGRGGKRGKTSGKGQKGQKSRAGNSTRPELRDTIKKFPKKRGFGKNRARTINDSRVAATPISLSAIDSAYVDGETVSPKTLAEKKVVRVRGGKFPSVKILGDGEIKTKVSVKGCSVSASAKAAIEKAGGSIQQ